MVVTTTFSGNPAPWRIRYVQHRPAESRKTIWKREHAQKIDPAIARRGHRGGGAGAARPVVRVRIPERGRGVDAVRAGRGRPVRHPGGTGRLGRSGRADHRVGAGQATGDGSGGAPRVAAGEPGRSGRLRCRLGAVGQLRRRTASSFRHRRIRPTRGGPQFTDHVHSRPDQRFAGRADQNIQRIFPDGLREPGAGRRLPRQQWAGIRSRGHDPGDPGHRRDTRGRR